MVRMDRASKHNAVDAAMTDQLDAALNQLEDDADVWAAVLTGTATVFSAGTDLVAGPGRPTARGGEYGQARRHRTKPLIAAVEGAALGGGLEMVLACDLVVASRLAQLGLPEVGLGLVANCGGLFRGPRALPLNVARELLLTGESLDAERAWSLGLVNVLTEPGAALDEAVALAGRICRRSPTAVRATLRALDDLLAPDDEQGWSATEVAWSSSSASPDSAEGVKAFLERREPAWADPDEDSRRGERGSLAGMSAHDVPRLAPVVDPDEEQAALLSKTLLTKDGRPLNLFATLAHNPLLLKRFNALGGFFLRHGELPDRERELVILRVAARTGSVYEHAQHVVIGRQVGLSDEEIERAGGPLNAWDEADRTLLLFVDEMIDSDGSSVTTWEPLEERLGDKGMLELSLLVGFYRMLAAFLVVVGVQVEGVDGD